MKTTSQTKIHDGSIEERSAPAFRPSFVRTPGMGLVYEDGRITAAVDITEVDGKKHLAICEWTSLHRGKGYTCDALRWFRSSGFNTIAAVGVGLIEDGVGDIATAYWQHMHGKGLVDVLIDDEGVDITPAPLAQQPMKPTMLPRSPIHAARACGLDRSPAKS